jgi:hypothetical protein
MAVRRQNYFPFLTIFVALMPIEMIAQTPGGSSAEPQLTLFQVVNNMVLKNAERAEALEGYRGKRTYQLAYTGFPTGLHAEMIVEMTYNAPFEQAFYDSVRKRQQMDRYTCFEAVDRRGG